MAKARLGDLLVKAGVISESQLRTTLNQQKQHGGKLGEHLVRTNLVSEQQLAIAVANQLGLIYNDCSEAHAAAFSAMVPQHLADQLQALPVRYDEITHTLHVAVADPLDEATAQALQRMTGTRIELQVAPKALLRQAIKVAYAEIEIQDEGTNEFALVDLAGRESQVIQLYQDDELPEASVLEMEPVREQAPPQQPAPRGAPSPFPVQSGRGQTPTPHQQQRLPTPAAGGPNRIAPPGPGAQPLTTPPPKPAPPSATAQHEATEEALRMIWALTDLLIEKGYLSRSELMAKLRNR